MTAALYSSCSTSFPRPFGGAGIATPGWYWSREFEASGYVARRSQRFFHLAHSNDTFANTPRVQGINLPRPSVRAAITYIQQRNGESIPKLSPAETRRAKQHLMTPRNSDNLGGAPDVHPTVSIVRVTQHGWKQPSVSYVADCAQTINRPSQTCLTGISTGTTSVLPTTRTSGNTPLHVYTAEGVNKSVGNNLLPSSYCLPAGLRPWGHKSRPVASFCRLGATCSQSVSIS